MSEALLPWSLHEQVWAGGQADPRVLGSDHAPMLLRLPEMLRPRDALERLAYWHTEGRAKPCHYQDLAVQQSVGHAQDDECLKG